MFKFSEEMIYTGKEVRTSQKGNQYIIVNYLDDKGQTFGTMANCIVPELNALDKVLVTFEVTPGRFLKLETVDMVKM